MEIQKVVIIGVDFKDIKKNNTSQHLYAEVVLIDKTQQTMQPLLYQYTHDAELEDPYLLLSKVDFSALDTNSFMMLGEVLEIDKKSKTIILSNDNTVTYNYLIIASGRSNPGQSPQNEFVPGLQTLLDALKIKKEVPFLIDRSIIKPKQKPQLTIIEGSSLETTNQSENIEKLANLFILKGTLNPLNVYLSGLEKRLYEVHM